MIVYNSIIIITFLHNNQYIITNYRRRIMIYITDLIIMLSQNITITTVLLLHIITVITKTMLPNSTHRYSDKEIILT